MPDKFIVPEVVTREAYADLLEQLEALDAAARRILDAPKGTSHRQFRFWLMDALGDSYPASRPDGEWEAALVRIASLPAQADAIYEARSIAAKALESSIPPARAAGAESSPASKSDVSERVDVRPQGPPTGGNPSVGEARSETFDPANAPFSDDPAAPIIAEESNQRNDDEERFVLSA